jgi:hypothetical protein
MRQSMESRLILARTESKARGFSYWRETGTHRRRDAQILRDSASTERLGELFYETGAWDLRVITASKEGAKEKAAWLRSLEAELQINSPDTPPRIKTFLDFSLTNEMPEIHDRFAIIDDVLWHCGATVGGLHNAINAMTFGWSANTTNAIAFFERLCEILGEFH